VSKKIELPCDEELIPIDRDTKWCREGRDAFIAGKAEFDCPHGIGTLEKRVGWLTAWHDARINLKFGATFARYGIRPDKSRGESWIARKTA
jgi:ribosome modulation factor